MSIYEVAQKAGVSIATVSRVINNSGSVRPETREKVEAALKELNYRPNAIARSLVVNTTNTIGILASDVRDSYYANAIYILEQEFRKLGYHVILCNTGGGPEKRRRYLGLLLEKKVDGMVLVGSIFKEKNGNQHILDASTSVPIVLLNSSLEGDNIYSVVCDDKTGVSKVVVSLALRGHRGISYVYDVDSFSGLAKLDGFTTAMKSAGLPIKKEWIIQTESGIDGGRRALKRLEDVKSTCTAIIASEDILAAGILKGLTQKGMKVPDEMVVFGYNDSIISQCTTPELSSVDNKVGALAKEASKVLYQVLQGMEVSHHNVVVPELVFRESCD
ncbi:MAG: LacI family transcriptional regulator [Clostridiales bacterium]|nr:LacI family transcriptional regulator [Clostridiales bacterium]